jgi:exopolysaccharide biosynthesis operon protein EpsL
MRPLTTAETLALLMVLGMIASPSRAEDTEDAEDTFTPYVRGLYGYDSNLFRLQNDEEAYAVLGTANTAESYYTLAAGMDVNFRVSRQVIKAHAEYNQTWFDKYSMLDYDGRDAYLKWDWSMGSVARGDVGISETLTQASYANVKQPVSNLIRTRRNFFHAAIKLDNPWLLKFGAERTDSDNNASILQEQDARVDAINAGVQYSTRKGSTVELVSQRSDGQYPNRQVVGVAPIDNDYLQWDNGVAVAWAPTGKTQVAGKLNYTQRNYTEVPQRDFSGLTGLLSMDWMVTDKTVLKASVHRDIGALENDTASYAVNQGIAFGADWKPTAKLAFNTQLRHDDISYEGDPGFVLSAAPAREDTLTTLQAGVQYSVLRNTTLGLVVKRGVRDSSEAFSSYVYNSALVNLRSEF